MDDINKKLSHLFVIRNADGTIRWVLPIQAKKPLFLAFYAVTNFRSFLISMYFQAIFFLGLKHLFFKKEKLDLNLGKLKFLGFDAEKNCDWAMFMGTIGPNNKRLLYFKTAQNKYAFLKIATTENAETLLANEVSALIKIQKSRPVHFNFPAVQAYQQSSLLMPDMGKAAKRALVFSREHFMAIQEISRIDNDLESELSFANTLNNIDNFLNDFSRKTQQKFPLSLLRKTSDVVQYLKNFDLKMGFAHGDLTPWNCYLKKEKLSIYDWELATHRVRGFDIFHFIIQKNILLSKKSWRDTYKEVNEVMRSPYLHDNWPEVSYISDFYLAAYLVEQIYDSIKLYSVQDEWHMQILWMIDFWNDALSDLLTTFTNHREVVLKDTLDFMSNKRYAGIKVKDQPIELLNEYSDIDWCIEKSDLEEILQFLKVHPAVSSYKITSRSFMSTLQLLLKDGSTVNYDFIWQFKVKGIEFLDHAKVLDNRELNDYGIYVLSDVDTARYIALFYFLNGAKIPNRYSEAVSALQNSDSMLDFELFNHFQTKTRSKYIFKLILEDQDSNKGTSGFFNRLNYYLDTCSSFFGAKGFLVTFSGVDGAGKSTIIGEFKTILEKKYRRRVVVIRHRPSVLPILSVWTKGKKKAHEDVVNALPRQGQNNNKLSSFLRFAYYYTDYVFGQFYVYFRYLLAGYIVLYDRYYFDFINDSRRSNLNISSKIVKIGYNFLMQPKFNFFLYADAKVIRARKQELEEADIMALTSSYLTLFQQYNKRNGSNYICLNNIEIKETLSSIEKQTLTHL